MKNFITDTWCNHRTLTISFLVALLIVFVVLAYFAHREGFAPSDAIQTSILSDAVRAFTLSDAIQSLALVTLVAVTIWYAKSTRDLARTNERTLRVAINSERSAVMPIIQLDFQTVDTEIHFHCANIGRGPALNLEFVLEFALESHERTLRSDITFPAAFVAGSARDIAARLPQDLDESSLAAQDFEIVAEYSDVFSRRFRSVLLVSDSMGTEFHFDMISEDY